LSALLSDRAIVAAGDKIGGGGVRIGLGIGSILELLFEFLNASSQSLNLSIWGVVSSR
jgi:hypothetical protein